MPYDDAADSRLRELKVPNVPNEVSRDHFVKSMILLRSLPAYVIESMNVDSLDHV